MARLNNINTFVTDQIIDLNQISKFVPESAHGAGNTFVGFVRNLNLGKPVVAVEYDCYQILCEKVFIEISREAQKKWSEDANILVIHRHGKLNVGEASVLISVTTKHRDESYRISRYIIEEIKVRAPIWKKEYYQDGQTDWVRGHALCQHRKVDHHEASGNHSCGGPVHSHEAR